MGNTMGKKHDENGLVAIIVATVIMVILSLITLGFARLMQSEQRQALDRSLSTQAFYAAESAINDVVRRIQDPNPATAYTENKDSCGVDFANNFDGDVDTQTSATYTCLIVDQAPDTLEYTQGAIGLDASKVVPIRSETGSPIETIRLSWENDNSAPASATNNYGSCPGSPASLPPYSGTGQWAYNVGMLRLDVIPADNLTRDNLVNNTLSLYLYPCTGSGAQDTIQFQSHNDPNEKGQIVPVLCTPDATRDSNEKPRDCDLRITFTGGGFNANSLYYLRMRSIYRASDLTVRSYNAAGTQVAIEGAQVQIDSTGKVNDVLRRIQVRVPVNKSYQVPEFVIQTTDSICKQLQITPNPTPAYDDSCGF